MIGNSMTLQGFEDALDRYGADIDRWPVDLRAPGRALMEQHPEARRLLAESRQLEAALMEIVRPVPLAADRLGRLLANLHARRTVVDPVVALARPRAAFAITMAATVMFVLGAWSGVAVSQANDDTDQSAFSAEQIALLEDF